MSEYMPKAAPEHAVNCLVWQGLECDCGRDAGLPGLDEWVEALKPAYLDGWGEWSGDRDIDWRSQ